MELQLNIQLKLQFISKYGIEEYTYMIEYMYSLYDGSEQTGT